MRPHLILQLNAIATAACGAGMLAARGVLYPLFGLDTSLLLDVIAAGLLAYAAALAISARRQPVTREALMFFTVADAAWVAASAAVLLLFWSELAPIARVLIIAVALVVEIFATLQFKAAGAARGTTALA